jgi:hypothetical protein
MNVWETLSAIDVSAKIEKKGNLSYLSWAWAWGVLKSHYPRSSYELSPPVFFADGSCEVWVKLTVVDGDQSQTHDMWLPVMDHKNNAIKNPDSRKISDARMRCLVKAIAMFGLGHYIYAGEDLPESTKHEPPELPAPDPEWIETFGSCSSMDALQELWGALSNDERHACAKLKDNAKARLQAVAA